MKFTNFPVLACVFLLSWEALGAPTDTHNISFAISAENLPGKDIFTHPDALVQVFCYTKTSNDLAEALKILGTTTYIGNDRNPEWEDIFTFNWKRGTGQTLLFQVIDHDVTNSNDHIGATEVSVDKFMENPLNTKVNLSHGGSLIIKHVMPITFKLSAKNLPRRDRFFGSNGLSDPYVLISYRDTRTGNDKEETHQLYRTPVLTDTSHPVWPDVIEFTKYEPKAHQILRFLVFDRDLFTRDEFLGEAFINADDLMERSTTAIELPLQRSEGNSSIIIRMPYHEASAGQHAQDSAEEIVLTTPPSYFLPDNTHQGY